MQELKNKFRIKAKKFRKTLNNAEKSKKDETIFKKITALKEYENAEVLLCYVSTENEIDTKRLIDYSLKIGKKIAVPKCFEKNIMKFYYISSLNDLKTGKFGILEPNNNAKLCENFENSLCIVPALSVDSDLNRLGYGGGFYDRFLKGYNGAKCVVCYKENMVEKLPINSFDVKADLLVTD